MDINFSSNDLHSALLSLSRERLEYVDFLNDIRCRLGSLCILLTSMEENFDSNAIPVYVNRAEFCTMICLYSCEEISRILSRINSIVSGFESLPFSVDSLK